MRVLPLTEHGHYIEAWRCPRCYRVLTPQEPPCSHWRGSVQVNHITYALFRTE